jgi:NitT/TauT family transport system permease protein
MLPALVTLALTLVEDTAYSWLRMLIALAMSLVISLVVGIWVARSKMAEKLVLPIVDILQTLPMLAFYPFVIFVVLLVLPPLIGVNAAVIFLIITSMLWNLIFAVYESIKTLPREIVDVGDIYGLGLLGRLRKIYIPAAIPKLIEQSILSWSIGLFYLVTSEIFSVGTGIGGASRIYSVGHGIGVALAQLAVAGNTEGYVMGIGIFIIFVVVTKILLFDNMERLVARRSPPPWQKKQLPRTGLFHRIALFREMQGVIRKEENYVAKEEKMFAKAMGMQKKPIPAVPSVVRKVLIWPYILIILALIFVALYGLGYLNGTTATYEYQSLVALAFTFARIWLAFIVILIVAVPLCVYIIFMSKNRKRYTTIFQILASIPATIVLPAIAFSFSGSAYGGEMVAFIIFFLSGFWYVVFSALADSRYLPEELFEVKKVFSIKGLNAWKNVYVKAIAPGLITGAITGIAAEWNASIVAEYFTSAGVNSSGTVITSVGIGLGKLLDTSLSSGNLLLMGIALINLTVLIIVINRLVWSRLYGRVADTYK